MEFTLSKIKASWLLHVLLYEQLFGKVVFGISWMRRRNQNVEIDVGCRWLYPYFPNGLS
jgi:hypothetical protein